MKKVFAKVLLCIIVSIMFVSAIAVSIPVKASEYGIMPLAEYEEAFSFRGSYGLTRKFDGAWLKVQVQARANNNNNETITLKVYIENRNTTKSYTFYSDGVYHTYKNIYLGSGGSNVRFTFTGANPEIGINMYFYAQNS